MRFVRTAVVGAVWMLSASALALPLPNVDVFLDSPQTRSLPKQSNQDEGAIAHTERRLGVPSFYWAAKEPYAGVPLRFLRVTPQQAARRYLQDHAPLYRVGPRRLAESEISEVHDTGVGGVIVKFRASVAGVPVFRDSLQVLMTHDLDLVAITGYLTPHAVDVSPRTRLAFNESPETAVARAFKDLTGTSAAPLSDTGKEAGGYKHFAMAAPRDERAPSLLLPARAKKVVFPLVRGLEPAYYVELNVGARASTGSDYYAYVLSARDGRLLFRKNLTEDVQFRYRVWAQGSGDFAPYDGPQGTAASPHPTGLPDSFQAAMVPQELVTLQNGPISTNDAWLPASAVETVGNNVDAYADVASPDGYNAGDMRATLTGPRTFDRVFDPSKSPAFDDDQRKAAVTELFYVINWLHDAFYDRGFNEQSGNAQADNYGRGGLDADSLKAEGQDFGGRNNANMSTPADGARPRMQQYLWNDPGEIAKLTVTAPASIARDYPIGTASFGATQFNVSGTVVLAQNSATTDAGTVLGSDGCTPLSNAADVAGKIAMIDRGVCSFAVKSLNAQNAGALAVIIVNNAVAPNPPGLGGAEPNVTIPTVSLTLADGQTLRAELANGVTVTMERTAIDRDSTIDNAIVAHEWGHYISNRLVGNSSGLSNLQGRGMGEGFGDFHGMLMIVRPEDALVANIAQPFGGAYATSAYVAGGGTGPGYYYGIRRYPYSTDFTKNPLTFKYIEDGVPLPTGVPVLFGDSGENNSEVHNVGEVWASMLWECYASLLRATSRLTFAQAQDRMMRYLVAGYKLMPNAPTILEARDAILASAFAHDVEDYTLMAQAFARRGAGLRALAPDRGAGGNHTPTESFLTGNDVMFVKAELDDEVLYCDRDGHLDNGETGVLTLTVQNSGHSGLSATTAHVTSTTPGVTFSNGGTVTFPATTPFQTATATLTVSLSGATDVISLPLQIELNDPGLAVAGPINAVASFRGNFDNIANASATDDVEATQSAWTVSADPQLSTGTLWRQQELAPTDHNWLLPNPPSTADVSLVSPPLNVAASGSFQFSFKHRYDFESDTSGIAPVYFDGAVVELSEDNGQTWTDLGPSLVPTYTGTLDGDAAGTNPLKGKLAFVGKSVGYPAYVTEQVDLGTGYAGKTVQVRFRMGADSSVGAPGWEIDDVSVSGLSNTPFYKLAVDSGGCINRPPLAKAGPEQTVPERSTVTLDGSASSDLDGDALSFQWVQTAGPTVTLSSPSHPKPTFTAPEVTASTVLSFQLTVKDADTFSPPVTMQITVNHVNRAPQAVARSEATVNEGTMGMLTLMASDPDGDAMTFTWTQVGGPTALIADRNAASTTFLAPQVSDSAAALRFQLVVSDGALQSVPAVIDVAVVNLNEAPTLRVELPERTVEALTQVTLTATATDPEGDALTYQWAQEMGPTVTLDSNDGASVTFIAPEVSESTVLTFTVKANDGKAASNVVPVKVTVNRASTPTAENPPVIADGTDHTTGSTGCGCNTGFEGLSFGASLLLSGVTFRARRRRR